MTRSTNIIKIIFVAILIATAVFSISQIVFTGQIHSHTHQACPDAGCAMFSAPTFIGTEFVIWGMALLLQAVVIMLSLQLFSLYITPTTPPPRQ